MLYYDPTFALFALLGMPFSALLSRPLLRRMTKNNERSAAMNARLYGFNQEAFSNIQTIKAFDLIHFYTVKLKSLQDDYIHMQLDFQKMSMVTAVLMSIISFIVSYSCYGWGIYRVWSNAISYGTMTMFLSAVRHTDQRGKLSGQPRPIRYFPDDFRRTSDGHCGNAAGRLQSGFCGAPI